MSESEYDKACRALASIYTFAKSEARIAKMQSDEARKTEDYRAADRAASYALAMAKIAARTSMIARQSFTVDVEKVQ